jgi:hypothetical protein
MGAITGSASGIDRGQLILGTYGTATEVAKQGSSKAVGAITAFALEALR